MHSYVSITNHIIPVVVDVGVHHYRVLPPDSIPLSPEDLTVHGFDLTALIHHGHCEEIDQIMIFDNFQHSYIDTIKF